MAKRSFPYVAIAESVAASVAYAQCPIMDLVANKVTPPIVNKMFECAMIP